MAAPHAYVMQFYRREPGDLGIPDIAVLEDQDMSENLKRALLGYFTNHAIAPIQRPHHARIVTHDGLKTVRTIMAIGPSSVEVIHLETPVVSLIRDRDERA
jgi:hypothetical protein